MTWLRYSNWTLQENLSFQVLNQVDVLNLMQYYMHLNKVISECFQSHFSEYALMILK